MASQKDLTDREKEALKCMRDKYEHTVQSATYKRWIKQAWEDQNIYDGDHWTDEEKKALQDRGQAAIIINKVAPKIDSLAGTEVQGQTRIAYNSSVFGRKDQDDMAKAFSHLAFHVQQRQNTVDKQSEAFKDSMVTGLGWLEVDANGDEIITDHADCFEMIWDVDDMSFDLSNQTYTGRHKWMHVDEAKNKWPEHKDVIDSLMENYKNKYPMVALGIADPSEAYTGDTLEGYADVKRNRVRIVELHYKKSGDVWQVKTEEGRTFDVYSKSDAEKFHTGEGKPVKRKDMINMFGFFCDDILLEEGMSRVQGRWLPYVPLAFKLRRSDRVPYGLVRMARDSQIEYNKRRSKAMHLLNTNQVIADIDAVEDVQTLLNEVARPDGVILKRPGKELQINNNAQMEQGQYTMMQQSSDEIQQTMGIFDEMQGQQTNATSGRAIAERKMASRTNQAHAFNKLSMFKKRFGEALFKAIQAAYNDERVIDIVQDDGAVERVKLNYPNAEGKIMNDVKTARFNINVVEVPNYDAPLEELREFVPNMVMNGAGHYLMSPEFNKIMGVSEPEKLAESIKSIMQSSAPPQQQQGGQPPDAQGQAAGIPSPIMGGNQPQ